MIDNIYIIRAYLATTTNQNKHSAVSTPAARRVIIKYKHEPNLPHVLDEILNGSQKEQRQGLFVAIDNEPLNFI